MRRAGWTVVVAITALAALEACGKQRPFGKNVPADAAGPDGTESGASPSGMTQDCASTTCTSNPEQLTPAGGLSGSNAEGQDGLSGANAGSADAGAACSAGATERCGPPAEEGACRFGTRSCVDGTWSECMGAVFGSTRDCTSAEDNDCDGQPDNVIDDVCRCLAMGAQPCDEHPGFDGRGSCRAGTQTCVLGPENATSDWGECVGAVAPQPEDSCTVAGDDADCDGTPNGGCSCVEGTSVTCGPDTDTGACSRGTSTCVNGAFTPCQGAVFPGRRDCSSALDNDCDGIADDTLDATCACAIGESRICGAHPGRDGNGPCRAGQQACQAAAQNGSSAFGACVGSVGPAQRDSCTVPNDDADCNGLPNTGCQCVAGQGNAPCSGDPSNSRCNSQGVCAPCQNNGDCLLISGGRNLCVGGVCVAPRCGDGITNGSEQCDDGNSVAGDGCSVICVLERNEGSSCASGTECRSGRCLDHYLDADEDGFAPIQEANRPRRLCSSGEPAAPQTTFLRPSGFSSDTDCCDTDALANGLFTSIENDPTACGHFDWNCNGVVETLYPNALTQPCNLIVVPNLCDSAILAPGGPELCGQEIQLTFCRFIQGQGCQTLTVTGGRDILLCH
jgi:cysteine-rich repeat protein